MHSIPRVERGGGGGQGRRERGGGRSNPPNMHRISLHGVCSFAVKLCF